MPRLIYETEPQVINSVKTEHADSPIIEIATTNQHKLAEFKRMLKNYEVIGKKLSIEEVQSLDPLKVISAKAKSAYEANQYNPILVEDSSLEIKGLESLTRLVRLIPTFLGDPNIKIQESEIPILEKLRRVDDL